MTDNHDVLATMIGRLALGALALVGVPATAAAQSSETAPGPGLELTGYAGVFTPLAKLADQGDTVTVELSTKVAFGVEAQYWLPGGLGIAIMGAYSRPDLSVQVVQSGGGFPVSTDLGRTDYWIGTASLVYRPNLGGSAAVLRPYFGLGAGVLSIDYPDAGDPRLKDETRAAGVLLAGAHITVARGVYLRLDLRDFVSSFGTPPFDESRTQHDVITSIGVGLRVP